MAPGARLRRIPGMRWVIHGRTGLVLVELIGRRAWIIDYSVVDWRKRVANAVRTLRRF